MSRATLLENIRGRQAPAQRGANQPTPREGVAQSGIFAGRSRTRKRTRLALDQTSQACRPNFGKRIRVAFDGEPAEGGIPPAPHCRCVRCAGCGVGRAVGVHK